MLFKSSCLEKDIYKVFDITLNCALQKRSEIFDY
jgi:hypothetical protein